MKRKRLWIFLGSLMVLFVLVYITKNKAVRVSAKPEDLTPDVYPVVVEGEHCAQVAAFAVVDPDARFVPFYVTGVHLCPGYVCIAYLHGVDEDLV